FRACFIDPWQGRAAARFALEKLGARRAAMIVDVTQPYAMGLAREFAREFTRPRARIVRLSVFDGCRLAWSRGRIVSRTFFQSGDQEFVRQIQTVAGRRPDVLYLPNYAPENALIAIQVRRHKIRGPGDLVFKVTIISGDASQSRALIERARMAVQDFRRGRGGTKRYPGFLLTGHFHPRAAFSKPARAFGAAFKKRYEGRPVSAWHALGADAYFLLLHAIGRAGSVQGAKVRRALARTRGFQGLTGRLIMTPRGDPKKGVVILKVSGDKFVYLTTVQP
ncbi:MAG: ABC transporter substrate-binding protein, partial [Proteobacteria bacterium]|nr:ABC transporter substrate-binding protein [Pseudomonadota bacterium]